MQEGKAQDITVLNVSQLTSLADYFIIASGTSTRHVQALADRLLDDRDGIRKPLHVEGYDGGTWILLDYGDIIIHVFREPERAFYGLERLWGDAPEVQIGG